MAEPAKRATAFVQTQKGLFKTSTAIGFLHQFLGLTPQALRYRPLCGLVKSVTYVYRLNL
jgi:hypothetical protein